MTIWKFPLILADEQHVEMPRDAEILCIQTQDGSACLWAIVDEERFKVKRRIFIRGTGHPLRGASAATYIGTYQYLSGRLIYHAFDGGEIEP